MIKAVVFDIDGTLAPEISWLSLTRDLGASVTEHEDIFERYKKGLIPYEEAKKKLIELWRKTGRSSRSSFRGIFTKWPLKQDAEGIIGYLRSKGYTLCVITGSMDLYAETVAKRLGILHFFANTELVWGKDGNLNDFHYELNQKDKKLAQLNTFCEQQNIAPENCAVIGDGENDTALFSLTKNGIVVESGETPRSLEDVSWKKITRLSEIKEFL